MKYVVIKAKGSSGLQREFPIIFPNDLTHSDVAKAVINTCSEAKDGKVVSAGSLSSMSIESDGIVPDGSTSLEMPVGREEDARLIYMHDYEHGLSPE